MLSWFLRRSEVILDGSPVRLLEKVLGVWKRSSFEYASFAIDSRKAATCIIIGINFRREWSVDYLSRKTGEEEFPVA